ncbi:MAG TPA: zf-TFIIB domain-containing protein [Pyrinomonadaceae bacterium]|nr:zf-TFIIB domain-containing protein [Pyrinomonadaceae bacterium]
MSDAFDQRRKGLEEEYFHRKNKEAIERLREKMKVAEEAKAAGTSSMRCPRCDGDLKESKVEQVAIDTCEKCGGIWLDSGELEELTKRDKGGWFSRLWGQEGS